MVRATVQHHPDCTCEKEGYLVDKRCLPAIERAAAYAASRIVLALTGKESPLLDGLAGLSVKEHK